MAAAQAFYHTRRGGHVVETIRDEGRALLLLTAHRGSVRIEVDGEVIGKREPSDGTDDKRIKWFWWLDSEALSTAIEQERAEAHERAVKLNRILMQAVK